jgi:hypothetical protein
LTARVEIIVPREIAAWERGFRYLVPELLALGLPSWSAATSAFFEATQSVVHVITGELRASGTMSAHEQGGDIIGTVEYTAPYARYEFRRGGSHDAMTRGWEIAQERFRSAMGSMWHEVVATWR